MAATRRVYLYGIALVALGMLVAGLAGLLEVLLQQLAEAVGGSPASVGADLLRSRVSLSGALTAIGLVAWIVHWGLAERIAHRGGDQGALERRSAIRKLFLYLGLFLGGLILTLAGQALLSDLLAAAFGRLSWAEVIVGAIARPLSLLLVTAALGGYYAGVARGDRQAAPEVGAGATLRRWYVYALSFFGLFLFLFAANGLLQTLWQTAVVPTGAVTLGGRGLGDAVASRLGGIAAGLALWYLAWSWSTAWFARTDGPDPENRSVLRKVYLYLVLAVAVAWTVWSLGRVLYELLRALLIPDRLAVGWATIIHDVGSAIVPTLVFGLAWAYHARVVEREAAVAGERRRQASIRWFYGYLVALVGLLTLAVGLAGTGATLLDLLVQPGAARPTHWWQNRVSLFATLVAVGLPIWAAYWGRLQREAADPSARGALVRRLYLFLAFGIAVLTLLGSGAFALYQVLRLMLGEAWTAGTVSELTTAVSTAAVAALFLIYHLRVFRGGTDTPVPTPAAVPLLALAVVRAPDAALLNAFRQELQARAPAGVEVQLLRVDAPTAERILAEARAG
jgi:hypothetical protein